ncbi:MAG TPA: hypothetical protein VHP37_32155 [Burkholderiales bacterium]|nr:hypothetical protein [Burkholderiales bacterium]
MSQYEVVSPLGEAPGRPKAMPARIADLNGMTIGELSNYQFHHKLTFDVIRQALLERYPGLKFVPFEAFGNIDDPNREADVVKALPDKLRSLECDAVITGNGG